MIGEVARARTFLFTPASRPDRFDKAAKAGADVVILDLEDAVAPDDKDTARAEVVRWLDAGGSAIVRINALDTRWGPADLAAVGRRAGVMLPKVGSADDARAALRSMDERRELLALVESPAGIATAREIAAVPGVSRIAFGHIDHAASIQVDPSSRDALLLARTTLVQASAEAGLPAPVDGVTTAALDDETLVDDVRYARSLGFGGKLCIHPRQVGVAAGSLAPTAEEVAWARRVLAASESGAVVMVDGHMIDAPVVLRAATIVERDG